jgi:hypothetical protein
MFRILLFDLHVGGIDGGFIRFVAGYGVGEFVYMFVDSGIKPVFGLSVDGAVQEPDHFAAFDPPHYFSALHDMAPPYAFGKEDPIAGKFVGYAFYFAGGVAVTGTYLFGQVAGPLGAHALYVAF